MSKRWGTDYELTDYRDLQANTMALDSTGSYLLLAGRRCFALRHLDNATDVLKKYPRQSKYEVGTAEWNPTSPNCHLCAVSSNTRVEILSFAGTGQELQTTHSLRGHTRVISDLNWHPKEPDIIATCSIDTFIHIWDIRDQRKPALSLSSVAGSSQVRWNPLSPNTLATSHDGDIKIWDQRQGNNPIQYITAHLTKIHGLDWCPFKQNQIATSSQDCTVKIFDTCNPRRAESILTTNSPVWRARYTPFGEGLVTIVVPQLRRGENSLLLWNTSNLGAPICTFVGHNDVVLEFQWRNKNLDNSNYELITWSKDQCLRIFKIDPFLKKLCGREIDNDTSIYTQYSEDTNLRTLRSVQQMQIHDSQIIKPQLNFITTNLDDLNKNNIKNDIIRINDNDNDIPSPTQPKTLQQEFSLINMNIPNIELNAMDAVERSCTVTARNKNYNIILKVNFPSNYPCNAQPTFQFCPGTTIDNTTMTKLLRVLKQTSQQRVKKNRSCLEPCLRQLITTLEQTCTNDETDTTTGHLGYIQTNNDFLNSTNICTNFQDTFIPFPRTSGAKFSSVGILVCFGRSIFSRRSSIKNDVTTPRALSALGTTNNNSGPFMTMFPGTFGQPGDTMSISSFYFKDRKIIKKSTYGSNQKTHNKNYSKNLYSMVTVFDVSSLFFINKELAEKYIINITDIPGMCQHNANIAASLERPDLVQAWCLAAQVISPSLTNTTTTSAQTPDIIPPWPLHPFGQNMIHSLIQHYANQSDIQMAGMLSCAFSHRSANHDTNKTYQQNNKSNKISPGGSPYHTIHPANTTTEGWNFQNIKHNRSNSWSESLDDLKLNNDSYDNGKRIKLLDDKNAQLYDSYKKAYAEVLHRWRLLDARAQVLKHVSSLPTETPKEVEFQSECQICIKTSKGPQCSSCKRFAFQCVICHISVRGPSNFCTACGHGGHTKHLATWFSTETVCPTGCGCCCLRESNSLLKM
ncbi:GATOR complex protein WDR59 isoform X2 [Aphidius gifuensis]|uniref:GATOR complex protein WDR59 isoform X2 n=1 Tax=Aphidius gifuensis TaxID=684658 RepID=UPI001CDBFE57|nr:GATOR complex protein WDR59 isoform X2 [Aphidius gifuensis]